MKKRSLFCILMIFLGSFSLAARDLSLEQAQQLAKKESWDIKKEQASYEKTFLQRRQVIATALPQLSANAQYQNYLTLPTISGFSLNSTHQVDYGLSVRQKLFEFGGIGNSLDAARSLLKQAEYKKMQVHKYTELEVTLAYYSVLLTQEQLDIAKSSLRNAQKNLKILKESFASGRAPRGDILRLQTDIVSRESQVNLATSDLESAHLALKEIIKVDKLEKLTLTTDLRSELPQIKKENFNRDALSDNPDLKVLQQNVEYLKKAAKVEKASTLPKLALIYNLSKSGRSDTSPTGFDESVDSQVIGLQMTWNIWDGGASRASYHEANKDALVAEYNYQKQRDEVFLKLNKAVNEYVAIQSNLATDQESLDLAQQSFELVQNLLRIGKTSITELNSTEGILNSIKASYASNLFKANERLSMIRYLMNEELGQ